jgi:hypothetical protein
MTEVEQAREMLARLIYEYMQWDDTCPWELQGTENKEYYKRRLSDKILSLKDPNGKWSIGIIDEQTEMLKEGYQKIITGEK